MAQIEHWLSTMSLVLRRKRFKFQVDFLLTDMCNVPFVNAVLYSKIRLHDGGSFCDQSIRSEVVNHHVYWGMESRFVCRIGSDVHTGMLEPCKCRVSVRKEARGGRSFQKLGYVDINLSEYAGSGTDGLTRTYLLEGYNAGQQRQDNSLIRVNISMVLLSSDPCFKVPPYVHGATAEAAHSSTVAASSSSSKNVAPSSSAGQDWATASDRTSMTSASSGFESLNKASAQRAVDSCGAAYGGQEVVVVKSRQDLDEHCKTASRASQLSQMSDYASSSVSHSRQSSAGSSQTPRSTVVPENMSSIFGSNKGSTVKKVLNADLSSAREFNSSRVDAVELITELLKDYKTTTGAPSKHSTGNSANLNDLSTGSGLKLFVSKDDGSAAIVGSSENLPVLNSKKFTQVVMEPPPW